METNPRRASRSFHSRGRDKSTSHFTSKGNRKPQTKLIPVEKFINKAVAPADEEVFVATHQFSDFALNPKTKSTLAHIGYEQPSPIQDLTIEPGLEGEDIIGLANTGTGKTAAFLLPIIERISVKHAPMSALVLAPTRELAQQIQDEFRKFAAGQKLYATLVVGGANINRQIQEIKRGPHVIIGTPGRVNDLIDRHVLRFSDTHMFVLDEADRMCDMGFVHDIRKIEAELPKDRQTFCFSATMTSDVQTIVEEFMHDPITVSVIKNATNDHIEQGVIHARDRNHKIELLEEFLKNTEYDKVIVFTETKHFAQRLSDKLKKDGYQSEAIHGNKSQGQRERALRDFKSGRVRVLVATDVAARGLDIPNVSHVINFDVPKQYDDYVHRIGRTGRAGQSGTAITFVSDAKIAQAKSQNAHHHPRPKVNSSRPGDAPKRKRHLSMTDAAENRLVNLIDSL